MNSYYWLMCILIAFWTRFGRVSRGRGGRTEAAIKAATEAATEAAIKAGTEAATETAIEAATEAGER